MVLRCRVCWAEAYARWTLTGAEAKLCSMLVRGARPCAAGGWDGKNVFQKLAKSIPMDWASAYREGGADEGRVRAQSAEHGLW